MKKGLKGKSKEATGPKRAGRRKAARAAGSGPMRTAGRGSGVGREGN